MKKILFSILYFVLCPLVLSAQQLPDPHFEDWSDRFNGEVQPAKWHGSNVSMVGFKFTFLNQKPGRTGNCVYIAGRSVGALGILEVAPGYVTLGKPWQYMKGLNPKTGTAGVCGGIAWHYRPDTMAVWIKRVGPATDKEDFQLLYYAWQGTAASAQYKSKSGGCVTTNRINEESDIRMALGANDCGTDEPALQIAEGWHRARAKYNEWTRIKVPIFYMNDSIPSMCNVIFSAGHYPAFRIVEGVYEGNALYVDDVELIYSSRIDKMTINGKEWKGFNPNSEKEQVYKLPVNSQEPITIAGFRGMGSLTNIKNETAVFNGRRLDEQEMIVVPGEINGKAWTIVVNAEDRSSTHVYKIKFVK